VPKLPVLSGAELVKVLQQAGFEEVRQRGSHVTLRAADRATVVPLHDELSPGTLLGILKQAGLTREEFIRLLGK